MTIVEKIVAYYSEYPPRLTNRSAGYMVNKFGCTVDDVLQAREIYRESVQNGTTSSPAPISTINMDREMDYDVEGQRLKAKLTVDNDSLTEEEIFTFFNLKPTEWSIARMWGIWKNNKYHMSVFFKPKANEVDYLNAIREAASQYSFPAKDPILEDPTKNLYAVIALFDAHIGRYAKKEYTGVTFNVATQMAEFYSVISSMLNEIPFDKVKQVILPVGNDFFNVDTPTLGTTRGTVQDNTYDLREMFMSGLKFLTAVIEYVSSICPIKVVLVPGNHDNVTSTYMAVSLEEIFKLNPNVSVDSTPIDRKYLLVGKTLLILTHGELKAQRLAEVIPHEAKSLFAQADYYECLQGHLHHEKRHQQEVEQGGIVIRNLAGMTKTDRWTFKEGYTTSTKRAYTIMYHETDGRKYECIHNL